ncbi:MAG TPA: pyridoxal phosphate-dependent aminotransferase, partial [Gammaproteobacteria bacterium]|nr:pyridoxal phosphate-dependent aminotransferase [Gammaproteobacteria bacterium]
MDRVQTPIIPAIGALIDATPGTISLGQGVVHFAPPPGVARAIEAFWRDPTNHQYGPIEGSEALRACIRAKLTEENGQQVTESQIIVTAGSNMAFLNTVLAITGPGDEIVVPAPYYFNQEMAIRSVDCTPVIVPVGEDHSPD